MSIYCWMFSGQVSRLFSSKKECNVQLHTDVIDEKNLATHWAHDVDSMPQQRRVPSRLLYIILI